MKFKKQLLLSERKFNEIINQQKLGQKLLDEQKAKEKEKEAKEQEEALSLLEECDVFEIVSEEEPSEEPPVQSASDESEEENTIQNKDENETTTNTPPAMIYCKSCYKKFNNLHESIIHVRHKCKEIFPCKSCVNIFSTAFKLENHVKSVHQEYKCDLCLKVFKSYLLLNKHKRYTHNKQRHFTCDICNKGLIDITAWRRHRETHKPKGEKRLFKAVKSKVYSKSKSVEAIENVCEICGKTLKSAKDYYLHYRYNHDKNFNKEKKFKCDQCDYSGVTKALLTQHIRVHTGERPYKCDQCSSAFKLPNALKYHITAIHLGLKNYECTICSKKLSGPQTLKAHLRRHTGEQPFVCDVCDKGFFEARPMRRHKAKCHPETVE